MLGICHRINLLADHHTPLCLFGINGKFLGGDSALQADSRFLGDTAAFGMTKLKLPSNEAVPPTIALYIRIGYHVYISKRENRYGRNHDINPPGYRPG
jgi:hypothetical protein